MNRLWFACVLGAAFTGVGAMAQEPPVAAVTLTSQARTIGVRGTSTVYVAPDEAELRIGVTLQLAKLAAARDEVTQTAAEVLAAIRGQGIEEKDIQTDAIQVRMHREHVRDEGPEKVSFIATREFRVTLRDIRKVNSVYEATVSAGANSISGPEYRSSEDRKHRDEARKQALKAALEKAQLMARELGVSVGTVRSIHEGAEPEDANSSNSWGYSSGAGSQTADAPPGQIAITASVEVIFDLVTGR